MADATTGQLKPLPGESSQQYRKRIEDEIERKKKAEREASKVIKAEIKKEDHGKEPAPKKEEPRAVEPQPQATQEPTGARPQVDPLKWAENKGYKTPEDMARALRQKDIEFHEKRAKEKGKEPEKPPAQTVPQWQPTPQSWQAQAFQPPKANRNALLQQYADEYGMTPEDFDRVLRLANDISDAKLQGIAHKFETELSSIREENAANTELRLLMSDPMFANPHVQYEMDRIMEENPSIMEGPGRYKKVFNKALENIARRNLQGKVAEPESAGSQPSRPPKTASGSSGTSPVAGSVSPGDILREKFSQAKTAAEKEKILQEAGAVKSY